jgi:hypothetical protein
MKLILNSFIVIALILSMAGCDVSGSSSSSSSTPPSVWLIGTAAPDNTVGNEQDMYLNSATSDVYQKINGAWTFAENVRGQTGAVGTQGQAGSTLYNGTVDPSSSIQLGINGDYYLNTTTNDVFLKSNNLWSKVENIKGPQGQQGVQGLAGLNGSVWYNGTVSPPPAGLGAKVGDYYLNATTGEVFTNAIAGWAGPIAVLKGTNGVNGVNGTNGINGTNGTNGSAWVTGASAPNPAVGNVGDFFLNTLTNDVYQKTSAGWGVPIATLKGPQGIAGTNGANGTNGMNGAAGTNGTFWCSSTTVSDPNASAISGCSNSGNGNSGDFYLNETTGDVWQKQSGTSWTKEFTLALSTAIQAIISAELSTAVPAGSILTYAGVECPSGFLAADGSTYTAATYPNLATALTSGSNYLYGGTVSGGSFNTPNASGVFLRGSGSQTISSRVHTAAAIGSTQADTTAVNGLHDTGHSHGITVNTGGPDGGSVRDNASSPSATASTNIASANLVGDTETRPANLTVTYCIKY